jgi:hypothetical protein
MTFNDNFKIYKILKAIDELTNDSNDESKIMLIDEMLDYVDINKFKELFQSIEDDRCVIMSKSSSNLEMWYIEDGVVEPLTFLKMVPNQDDIRIIAKTKEVVVDNIISWTLKTFSVNEVNERIFIGCGSYERANKMNLMNRLD